MSSMTPERWSFPGWAPDCSPSGIRSVAAAPPKPVAMLFGRSLTGVRNAYRTGGMGVELIIIMWDSRRLPRKWGQSIIGPPLGIVSHGDVVYVIFIAFETDRGKRRRRN